MGELGIAKARWDDAGDNAAAGERGIGEETHQPDPAAAIDEPDPRRGETGAELACRLPVLAIDCPRRSTVHA
jgi:hypothetical protein